MSAIQSMHENLRFTIEVLKGPHAGAKLEFEKTSVTIGRGPENDVVLSEDPRVSRQHVEIKQSLGQFYVVNLSQKNFVLLNGQNMTSDKLETKAVLQIGESELVFSIQGSTKLLEPVAPVAVVVPIAKAVSMPPPVAGAPAPAFPPPSAPPGYQYPPLRSAPGPAPRRRAPVNNTSSGNRKIIIFVVIGVLVLLFVLTGNRKKTKKADDRPFRTEEEIRVNIDEANNEIKAFQERKEKMNQQLYQKAYENFLRGYRDYRQGQYVRARESFQVVLNLDPDNELARRYLNLAKIRFDENVKVHMLQGRRYLEKHNYRMCMASYQVVMTMLGKDPSSPEYREALEMHRQCRAAQDGRF